MSHVAVMRRCRQARRDVGSGAGERSAQYILSRLIIVRRDDHTTSPWCRSGLTCWILPTITHLCGTFQASAAALPAARCDGRQLDLNERNADRRGEGKDRADGGGMRKAPR